MTKKKVVKKHSKQTQVTAVLSKSERIAVRVMFNESKTTEEIAKELSLSVPLVAMEIDLIYQELALEAAKNRLPAPAFAIHKYGNSAAVQMTQAAAERSDDDAKMHRSGFSDRMNKCVFIPPTKN